MTRAVEVLLATVIVLAAMGAASTAAASAQPTPVCPVCGQTFHENVTATEATLEVQADGDVVWHVENQVTDPTADTWRENETALRERVDERLEWRGGPPFDPSAPTVTVEGDTATVSFVDRNAARQRFGLLVVPYLHGEGVEARYVVNADVFVVAAPEGHRVVNDPAGATVEDDRAVWEGVASTGGRVEGDELRAAPEPGDTYVVFGSSEVATVSAPVTLTLLPLVPALYGFYLLGSLVVLGLSGAGYGHARRELDRRWLVGLAVPTVGFVAFVLSLHPIPPSGTLPGFGMRLMLLLLAVLFGLVGALAFVAAALVVSE